MINPQRRGHIAFFRVRNTVMILPSAIVLMLFLLYVLSSVLADSTNEVLEAKIALSHMPPAIISSKIQEPPPMAATQVLFIGIMSSLYTHKEMHLRNHQRELIASWNDTRVCNLHDFSMNPDSTLLWWPILMNLLLLSSLMIILQILWSCKICRQSCLTIKISKMLMMLPF